MDDHRVSVCPVPHVPVRPLRRIKCQVNPGESRITNIKGEMQRLSPGGKKSRGKREKKAVHHTWYFSDSGLYPMSRAALEKQIFSLSLSDRYGNSSRNRSSSPWSVHGLSDANIRRSIGCSLRKRSRNVAGILRNTKDVSR